MRRILIFFIFLMSLVSVSSAVVTIPGGIISSYTLSENSYVLGGNVTADGTAFLAWNNVNFDGMGHTITYAINETGYGFISNNRNNVTITNVTIINSNTTTPTVHSGLYLYNCTNADISNVYSQTHTGYGFRFYRTSHSSFDNLTGVSGKSYGAYIYSNTSHNNFTNINGTSNLSQGIRLERFSNNNTFANCTGGSTASSGVLIYKNSTNNSFTFSEGVSVSEYGLRISDYSNNNYFANFTTNSETFWPVKIYRSSGNVFTGHIISSLYANYPIETNNTVLLFGDSITAGGFGETPYGAWGTYLNTSLNTKYNWTVTNGALAGETSTDARIRFTQFLDLYEPTHVTIMYGANNANQNLLISGCVDDIEWMYTEAESRNITPLIMITPAGGPNYNNTYLKELDSYLLQLVKTEQYNYIDIYDLLDTEPNNGIHDDWNPVYYNPDGIHTNNAGNLKISNAVYEFLYPLPKIEWSHFENSNITMTGAFTLSDFSPDYYINISITDPIVGGVYWIYNETSDEPVANGTSYINATGIGNGEYLIFKTGFERILMTKWDLSSSTFEGRFTISNSTPASQWNINISDVLYNVTYRIYLDGSPTVLDSDDTSDGYANLSVTGLVDGDYLIVSESRYGDFVNPSAVLLSFVLGTAVLVGGYFVNKFRRREV